MKKLDLRQMENLEGGIVPSGGQVTCYVISVGMGLCTGIGGIICGALCLFVD